MLNCINKMFMAKYLICFPQKYPYILQSSICLELVMVTEMSQSNFIQKKVHSDSRHLRHKHGRCCQSPLLCIIPVHLRATAVQKCSASFTQRNVASEYNPGSNYVCQFRNINRISWKQGCR